ncbi:MAG TPA: cytochrome c oxidase subunit 3 [Armatimonadota bacterium]|jgi:cytochrome c oxidase subunit 3
MAPETQAVAIAPEHGLLHHHFDDLEQQREATGLGMWLFLATEAMMFGGLFLAYTLYRWMLPESFAVGSKHLNIALGTGNTFVLLFSSLTMAMAVHAAATKNRRTMVLFLMVTWVLGAVFLGVKAVEWTADYHEGLVPAVSWHYFGEHPEQVSLLARHGEGPNHVMMYFVLYFCMTGLHAIHMVIGLLMVGIMILMGARGAFTQGNDQPVELVGLYWHFVDIIWIFLFPLLYLIVGFHSLGGH